MENHLLRYSQHSLGTAAQQAHHTPIALSSVLIFGITFLLLLCFAVYFMVGGKIAMH